MGLKFNLSILFAAVASASLFAAGSVESRLSNLERDMGEMRVETAMGNYGITTASASPQIVDGTGFFITGGVIYHHANVNGTEFTYTDDDPGAVLPVHGRAKEMDFSWDWGLRVGVGYVFEHDYNWDLYLNYTWFDSHGSRHIDSGLNGSLIPLRASCNISEFIDESPCPVALIPIPPPDDPPFPPSEAPPGEILLAQSPLAQIIYGDLTHVEHAKSQYDVDFNIINLELGRAYFISRYLALRPHFGVQNTWIDLQQVTRYFGGDVIDHNTVDVKEDSDFWGLGPRAGVDTKWFLGCEYFHFFGNVSGALLWGRFDVDHREKYSLCPNVNRIHLDANKHRFVPTAQFQLGFGWEKYFNCEKVHVGIRLGYDAQFWWRANQMLRLEDSCDHTIKYNRYTEDVSMHGLMLDARIDF